MSEQTDVQTLLGSQGGRQLQRALRVLGLQPIPLLLEIQVHHGHPNTQVKGYSSGSEDLFRSSVCVWCGCVCVCRVTLNPAAPGRPGGPSLPGLPCGESHHHVSCYGDCVSCHGVAKLRCVGLKVWAWLLTSRPASPCPPVMPGIPMFPEGPRGPGAPDGPTLPGSP